MNNPTYKVSVSVMEMFRRYMEGEIEEQPLIDQITRAYEPSQYAQVGTIFHRMVEQPERVKHVRHKGDWAMLDLICLPWSAFKAAQEYKAMYPNMQHEIKAEKTYEFDHCSIVVRGRLDGMIGKTVRDVKLMFGEETGDYQEIGKYTDSLQHSFYMDMTGAPFFAYDCFKVEGFTKISERTRIGFIVPGVSITYAGALDLQKDDSVNLKGWLHDFLCWAAKKKLFTNITLRKDGE